MRIILALMLLLPLILSSCSTGSVNSVQNENSEPAFPGNVHALSQIHFYSLRFRRPPYEPMNPKAGPGGVDYKSSPLPNESFDCQKPEQTFGGVNLGKLRACLATIKAPMELLYRLRREPSPSFVLDDPESRPACLREAAPSIPIPRELVFQSSDEKRLLCYSSRLDLRANEVMGLALPIRKLAVKIVLPLKDPPASDAAMLEVLTTWALAPFWSENRGEGETLQAKILPDAVCRKCLGEKNMIRETDPPQPVWPSKGGEASLPAPPLTLPLTVPLTVHEP